MIGHPPLRWVAYYKGCVMNLRELIEILERMAEQHDADEVEVRLAQQPSWPLEYKVGRVILHADNKGVVLYVAEGEQMGYLSGDVSKMLGW